MLDADKATVEDDPLFQIATHVVFSAECLTATTQQRDLAEGLWAMGRRTDAFVAVSNGPNDRGGVQRAERWGRRCCDVRKWRR